MSKRTKLILGIVIGGLIILSGAIFGLAKTGVIHIKMLASEVGTGEAYITVDSTNYVGFQIYQSDGVTPVISSNSGSGWDTNTSTYSYHILNLPFGTYKYKIGSDATCWSPLRTFNFSQTNTSDAYPKFPCDGTTPTTTTSVKGQITSAATGLGIPEATIFFGNGGQTISISGGSYSISNITSGDYVVTVFASGYNSIPSPSKVTLIAGDNTKYFALTPDTTVTTPPPTVSDPAFTLYGAITDGGSTAASPKNLMGHVDVKVTCDSGCGNNPGPWTGSSTPAKQSGLLANANVIYNYTIPGIYNINQTGSTVSKLSIEFTYTGYKVSGYYSIFLNDITSTPNGTGSLRSMAKKDAVLDKVVAVDHYIVGGRVGFYDDPTSAIQKYISISGDNYTGVGEMLSDNFLSNVGATDKDNYRFTVTTATPSVTLSILAYNGSVAADMYHNMAKTVTVKIDKTNAVKLNTYTDGSSEYFIRQDFLLQLATVNNSGYFQFSGYVKNALTEELIPGVTIEVSPEHSAPVKVTSNSDVATASGVLANFLVNIPFIPNAQYTIKNLNPTLANGLQLNPSQTQITFSASNIATGTDGKKYFTQDYSYTPKSVSKKIIFRNAVTGAPINVQTESKTINKVDCLDSTGSVTGSCQISDTKDADKSAWNYQLSLTPNTKNLRLSFESTNFTYSEPLLVPFVGDSVAYLIPKTVTSDSLFYCVVVETDDQGCTFAAFKDKIFKNANQDALLNIFNFMRSYWTEANGNTNDSFVIYFSDSGIVSNDILAKLQGLYPDKKVIFLSKQMLDDAVQENYDSTLSALTNQLFNLSNRFPPGWDNFGDYKANINMQLIRNINSDMAQALGSYITFIPYWVLHQKEAQDVMNNANIKNDEKTKNSLGYIFDMMNRALPNIRLWQKTNVHAMNTSGETQTASITNSSKVVSSVLATLLQNLIYIQTAKAANSDLTTLMNRLGYQEIPKLQFQTVANYQNMNLTNDQIASGVWLNANYNALPATEKFKIQASIVQNKADALIVKVGQNVQNVITAVNQSISNLLVKFGLKQSAAYITGSLDESVSSLYQETPVSSFIVSIGGKIAQTNALGAYRINALPIGKLDVKVTDPKTGKSYIPMNNTVNVGTKTSKITGFGINIATRPNHTLSGQIYAGNTSLANGKIFVTGSSTISLDKDGKFSFQLKEGQYILTIKDSKGKVRTVTNSGTYGNMSKVNVLKDFNSLIWVK